MRFSLPILILALLFVSCRKERKDTAPDFGYDYYPGTVGSYIEYDVDSISYIQLPQEDTLVFKFRIKEKIDCVITDNQGRPTLHITRFKKNYDPLVPYSQQNWIIKDVWAANISKSTVEVVEENVRYVKLSFPVTLNKSWNGNAQNTIGRWDYKYTAVDENATYGILFFPKTLTVTQKFYPTQIGYQKYVEQYAKNVGLIYREVIDYKYKQSGGVVLPGVISEGVYYKMKVIAYGQE